MNTEILRMVRPDAKGRIALGILAKDVSSFAVMQEVDRIILIPYAEIPVKEKWLFDNQEALDKVKRGLRESAAGKVCSLGSFKKHINTDVV